MTSKNRNRTIHIVGVLVCLVAIILISTDAGLKSMVARGIEFIALLVNAYGVWRPKTWFH